MHKYKKYNFISFESFKKPGGQMHLCNENMNAMLVLKFQKKISISFKKFFDFSDFSKISKTWDVTICALELKEDIVFVD